MGEKKLDLKIKKINEQNDGNKQIGIKNLKVEDKKSVEKFNQKNKEVGNKNKKRVFQENLDKKISEIKTKNQNDEEKNINNNKIKDFQKINISKIKEFKKAENNSKIGNNLNYPLRKNEEKNEIIIDSSYLFEITEKLKIINEKNKKKALINLNSEILQDLRLNNNTCKNFIAQLKNLKLKYQKEKKEKFWREFILRIPNIKKLLFQIIKEDIINTKKEIKNDLKIIFSIFPKSYSLKEKKILSTNLFKDVNINKFSDLIIFLETDFDLKKKKIN